jgi:hypothetical protein
MSDSNSASFPDFGKLVPGFDFLQNLTRQASSAAQSAPQMPQLGSWVAPTLNVEELDKRIQELKAVLFWLDQNSTALKATVQALEVQKMTLATLKGMNVSMNEMAQAFSMKSGDAPSPGAAKAASGFAGLEVPDTSYQKGQTQAAPEPQPAAGDAAKAEGSAAEGAAEPRAGVVDPMQWWGALTQQFQTIANAAMKDAASRGHLAPDPALGQGGLKDAMKAASDLASEAGKTLAKSASQAGDMVVSALRGGKRWGVPGASDASAAAATGKKASAGKSGNTSKTVKTSKPAAAAKAVKTAKAAKTAKATASRAGAAKPPASRKAAPRKTASRS